MTRLPSRPAVLPIGLGTARRRLALALTVYDRTDVLAAVAVHAWDCARYELDQAPPERRGEIESRVVTLYAEVRRIGGLCLAAEDEIRAARKALRPATAVRKALQRATVAHIRRTPTVRKAL